MDQSNNLSDRRDQDDGTRPRSQAHKHHASYQRSESSHARLGIDNWGTLPAHPFCVQKLESEKCLKIACAGISQYSLQPKVISVVSVNMHLLSARLSKDHSCSTTVTSSSDTNVRELLVITSNMYCPCNIRISDVCCFIFLQCCNVMCVFAFATKIVRNTQLLAFTMRPYGMIHRWP